MYHVANAGVRLNVSVLMRTVATTVEGGSALYPGATRCQWGRAGSLWRAASAEAAWPEGLCHTVDGFDGGM